MRSLLSARAIALDRAVLLLLVCVNLTVLAKFKLSSETFFGAINGGLAAALLGTSLWRPAAYVHSRTVPIMLLRLLICILPLVNDTVAPFANGVGLDERRWGRQLGHAAFMLLVGISWTVGAFLAALLLLPPAQHLAVQGVCLAILLQHNKSVCHNFLAQAPGSAGIIDAVHAALRAGTMSVAPSAAWAEDPLAVGLPRLAACQASAAAMQVSLGGVLPTLLAWQLQSRIAASLVAEAQARHDSAVMQQLLRSQHATLCGAVALATQGFSAKLLITLCSMLATFAAALVLLA